MQNKWEEGQHLKSVGINPHAKQAVLIASYVVGVRNGLVMFLGVEVNNSSLQKHSHWDQHHTGLKFNTIPLSIHTLD